MLFNFGFEFAIFGAHDVQSAIKS